MIEVVFGDSACGSLKMAQHYGEGEYQCCISVATSSDEADPEYNKLIEEARLEAERKHRGRWEKATPMGGDPGDVYGFSLALSVGDISEDSIGVKRLETLEWLYSIYPDNMGKEAAFELQESAVKSLDSVCKRIAVGEETRIWYSNNPDEMCGLYWFMNQIIQMEVPFEQIYSVKLPEWDKDENESDKRRTGCGELAPEEWIRYLPLQKLIPTVYCRYCSSQWKQLQTENALLRAVLNGQLVSVPKTLYDDFIIREINKADDVFNEAMIIGKVLGKYHLGIGDAWVAHRIEQMILEGKLETVTSAAKDAPIYHRELKKSDRKSI